MIVGRTTDPEQCALGSSTSTSIRLFHLSLTFFHRTGTVECQFQFSFLLKWAHPVVVLQKFCILKADIDVFEPEGQLPRDQVNQVLNSVAKVQYCKRATGYDTEPASRWLIRCLKARWSHETILVLCSTSGKL